MQTAAEREESATNLNPQKPREETTHKNETVLEPGKHVPIAPNHRNLHGQNFGPGSLPPPGLGQPWVAGS